MREGIKERKEEKNNSGIPERRDVGKEEKETLSH